MRNDVVLWEGKSPLKSRDALSIADEPNRVRVVDLSGRFHDKRFGTVMVQGLIEDNEGINEGWNSNYGERVAVKILLEEVKALREVAEKANQYLDSEQSGPQDAMLRQRRQLQSALATV